MPISTLTAITPIAEGSEATPGLWNSRFSQLQQNVQELNIQAIGLLSGFVTGGSGSPESVQTGTPGFIYVQLDAAAEQHPVWVKFTGSGTTGWRGFSGFQGTGVDSYQFGRGASAAGLNASAVGPSSGAAASASQAWGYLAAANQPSAIAVGPNSRASGPNALAFGLNTYAGQINAMAIGSAATSDATGGVAFGPGVQVSHQSTLVVSSVPVSSQSLNELQVSGFSALRSFAPLFFGTSGENLFASGLTFAIQTPVVGGSLTLAADYLMLGRGGSVNSLSTTGFPQIPTSIGTPTGSPSQYTGWVPLYFDRGTGRLWIYNTQANAWKSTVFS